MRRGCLAALIALGAAACGGSDPEGGSAAVEGPAADTTPMPAAAAESWQEGEVPRLSMTARRVGREIRIEGTTDLPDGSVLDYIVRLVNGEGLPIDGQTEVGGELYVQAGAFSVSVDTAEWPEGAVEVWVGSREEGGRPHAEAFETVHWP